MIPVVLSARCPGLVIFMSLHLFGVVYSSESQGNMVVRPFEYVTTEV